MLQVYVKYSVCELIWEVFSRVFEAAIRVVNASDKIMIETQKKRENVEIKYFFLQKSPSKRSFRDRIRSLLKRADARGSADIIYRI